MRCADVQQRLNAFVDDAVSPAVACELERHFEKCHRCRALAHRLRRLEDVMSSAAALPVPGGFSSRVLGAARRQILRSNSFSSPASLRPRGFRRVTALHAVAVALLVLGFTLGTWMASQTWELADASEDATAARTSTPGIGGFYGADSDAFDAQRPLAQMYMGVVDRNASGD